MFAAQLAPISENIKKFPIALTKRHAKLTKTAIS